MKSSPKPDHSPHFDSSCERSSLFSDVNPNYYSIPRSSTISTPTSHYEENNKVSSLKSRLSHNSLPHNRHDHQRSTISTQVDHLVNSLSECHSASHPLFAGSSLKPIRELEGGERNQLSLTRRQLTIIFALIYGNFWVAACVSLQAPFFPKEAEMKGATPTQYGLVFGIYELMILLTAPLFGKLVNRVTPVIITKYGLLVCGASTMVFGFIDQSPAGWPFITLAYAIRIVEGISASAFMTSSYTVMAAKFPTRVASTFSYLEAAFGVGLIAGPTVGGALYQVGGFTYPFLALGLFLLVGCFVVHFLLPIEEQKSLGQGGEGQEEGNMMRFISDRGMIFDVMAIVTSLNFIGFNAATLEPHLRQFGLSPFSTGLVFIINGVTYALSTPIWGKLCERDINPKLLIVCGSTLCCIGLVFLGPLPFLQIEASLSLVVVSLVLIGFGMSAKMVCSFIDAMNDSIKNRGFKNDVSTYGLVSAMFFTSCSIGAFLGPSVGGFLLDTLEYRPSTILVFAIDVFMTLYGLFFLCSGRKRASIGRSIHVGA